MKRLMDRLCWMFVLLSALMLALSLAVPKALAQDDGWPRTVPVEQGMITIYPLQVDSLEGETVRYRAALAWRETPDAEPVFGAAWFESRVVIDREKGIVHARDLRISRTRFPAGTSDVEPALQASLSQYSPGWDLDYSTDRLDRALQAAKAERDSMQQINTAPPRIVYRDRPALLVTLDGDPILRAIEDSTYQAVVNTPYPLLFDGREYWLNVAQGAWYRAPSATGPYRFAEQPPSAIAALVKPEDTPDGEAAAEGPAPEPITAGNAPEIVVATQPTELVVTEGPAAFVPLVEDLLVLQNSDDDVFMHVGSQKFYIVLSGRWYQADSLNGPWEYQAADQLPAAFAEIPQTSAQSDARVYVAGTPEAENAVLDAQVPQTAAVQRGTADIDVVYDGDPEFADVDGADLEYAVNSGSTVLHSDRRYFLVEDGVWYVSNSPDGPWRVADYRPAAVDAIEPTSPVYNVKYVYVYDSTPDVVYVGYTPGYLGSYVYYDTVVYGTGWYYRPWVSPRYYYPRFSTWGFNVAYNPWGGWSFGLSWNWGWGDAWFASFGWGWGPYYTDWYRGGYWHRNRYWNPRHHYGYWGPRGYCPRPAPYRHGPYRDRHQNYGHDRYTDRGPYNGGRYGRGYPGRHPNLYRDADQRARVANTRDKLPHERGWSDERMAGVRNTSRAGKSGLGYVKPQGVSHETRARYAGGPVKAADLRRKAEVRDVNASARQRVMLADSSGKVYRKPDTAGRSASRGMSIPSRAASKGVTRNKTQPAKTAPSAAQVVRARPTIQRPDKPAARVARSMPTDPGRQVSTASRKQQGYAVKKRIETPKTASAVSKPSHSTAPPIRSAGIQKRQAAVQQSRSAQRSMPRQAPPPQIAKGPVPNEVRAPAVRSQRQASMPKAPPRSAPQPSRRDSIPRSAPPRSGVQKGPAHSMPRAKAARSGDKIARRRD